MSLSEKLGKITINSGCPIPLRPDILLQPNIPKPLHGVAPRVVLGQAWWDKTRKDAQVRTNYHCIACGVHKVNARYHKWLEGHEVYDINYDVGRAKYIETVPLCHFCHNFIHDGRLRSLLEKGEIHHAKFVAIIQHGERVLAEAGLKKSSTLNSDKRPIADWSKWRLILFGKKYKPIHANRKEWEDYHGNV